VFFFFAALQVNVAQDQASLDAVDIFMDLILTGSDPSVLDMST
jgi:hypothetical protein